MRKSRVLVIGEGTPDFWHRIAVGFSTNGARVSFIRWRSDLPNELMGSDQSFDLIVTNQQVVNGIAAFVRDNRDFAWRRVFKKILMVQYHDVNREIPTLLQASLIFSWVSIRLSYLTYVKNDYEFIKSMGIYSDVLCTNLPLIFDKALKVPEHAKNRYIEDVADFVHEIIPPAKSLLSSGQNVAFFPKILYAGSCGFRGKIPLRNGGSFGTVEEFVRALNDYKQIGTPFDRLGFVRHMLNTGRMTRNDIIHGYAGDYVDNYGAIELQKFRLDCIRVIKNHYGHDFHLYGTDWNHFGFSSTSIDGAELEQKYGSAFISPDFGSQFLDSSLYQRTMQIVTGGGRFIQAKQQDSQEIYADFSEHICFSNIDEMMDILDKAFSHPRAFVMRQVELAEFLRQRFDCETAMQPIIEHMSDDPGSLQT